MYMASCAVTFSRSLHRGADLQRAMQRVRHIPDLERQGSGPDSRAPIAYKELTGAED
jgi:hypothetical protein